MIFRLRTCLAWLLLSASLLGAGPAPAAPMPMQTALLVDETGLLEDATGQALLDRLTAIHASGRAQIAILLARSTHGEALSDYALQVAQAWQLGRSGRDDGLLVVLVPSAIAARIEVGYGLEGAIPDVQAARWVDTLLLPALKDGKPAEGLDRLLDAIDLALPAVQARQEPAYLLDQHPEWKLPFVLVVFSVFALFPLFMGRWGARASAPLYAAFMAPAAWLMWESKPAAVAAGATAFMLPLLWGLNARGGRDLPAALSVLRAIGNAAGVLIFFSIVTLFITVGLWHVPEARWGGPLFAGTLALGLAAMLFPSIQHRLMIVLRSVCHFVFILALAYPALMEVMADPAPLAFGIAGAFTALIALSLWMDARETRQRAAGQAPARWSLWVVGLALLLLLPVGVLMLLLAALGADFQTRLVQAAAGGGSLAGAIWWAARHGFFAALKIGLGGRFGGGGAEGRG